MRNTSVPKTARAGGHRTASRWGAPLTSLLGALVLVIGLVVPTGTAANAAAPSGTVGAACAPGTGVTAVVDFATTDADTTAPVRIGCAPGVQTSIRGAFTAAGFDLGADAFTCAIDGVLAEPRGCGTWPGAYWSLFTSTDTGTFPGTPVTAWNYASTGVDNGAQVPVGSSVLYQIQPDAPDRTPRIALADLAVAPSGGSSSASSPSGDSSDTASSVPSTPSSSESSPSQDSSSSTQDSSSTQESSSAQSTGPGSSAASSASSGDTTGPTTSSPAPTLPPVTPTTDARALAAAHWLGEQLANAPNGLFGNPDFPDYGLTIDALLALSAAGVGGDLIAATAAKIQRSGEDYIGAADDTAGNFARIAKTALALQVAGLDPTAFPSASGSRDLITELRGTLNADGSFGSSDFPFVHALALYSLARTAEEFLRRRSAGSRAPSAGPRATRTSAPTATTAPTRAAVSTATAPHSRSRPSPLRTSRPPTRRSRTLPRTCSRSRGRTAASRPASAESTPTTPVSPPRPWTGCSSHRTRR